MMRTAIHRVVQLLVVVLLAACTSPAKFTTAMPPSETAGVVIERLYVYSFLDVRDDYLGRDFIRVFEQDLQKALTDNGVTARQLWYKRSNTALSTSLAYQQDPIRNLHERTGSTKVPIGETIKGNHDDEVEFRPTHRLVIFPQGLKTNGGGGITTEFRWDLTDARTGRFVWSTTSTAQTHAYLTTNERAAERSKEQVDGFVAAMKNAGILK
jgi:hypothetical protein